MPSRTVLGRPRTQLWLAIVAYLVSVCQGALPPTSDGKGAVSAEASKLAAAMTKLQMQSAAKKKKAKQEAAKPSVQQAAKAKEVARLKLREKFAAKRMSAAQAKASRLFAEQSGAAAARHHEKLQKLAHKSKYDERTIQQMVNQGSRLVESMLREPRGAKQVAAPAASGASVRKTKELQARGLMDKDKRTKDKFLAKQQTKKTKKLEKFQAVIRAKRRVSKAKLEQAKKKAKVLVAKAKSLKGQSKSGASRKAELAGIDAKIATSTEKMDEYKVKVQDAKLKASKRATRETRHSAASKKEEALKLKNEQKVLAAKMKGAQAKVKAAKRQQQTAITQAKREQTVEVLKAKQLKDAQKVASYARVAKRDKSRELRALRKSKSGDASQLDKFDKFRSAAKIQKKLARRKQKEAMETKRKLQKTLVVFAKDDVSGDKAKLKQLKTKVSLANEDLTDLTAKAKDAGAQAKSKMKDATKTGTKSAAKMAAAALKSFSKRSTDQEKGTNRLSALKSQLRDERKKMRKANRVLKKDEKVATHHRPKSLKQVKRKVQRDLKVASQVAKQSLTSHRIMRQQAQVLVRKKARTVVVEGRQVKKYQVAAKAAKATVKRRARAARRVADKYRILIQAAQAANGKKTLKVARQVATRIKKLDKAERAASEKQGMYKTAQSKLNVQKGQLQKETKKAISALRLKVKLKTHELKKKRRDRKKGETAKLLKRKASATKWLTAAKVHVLNSKKKLKQAQRTLVQLNGKQAHQVKLLKYVKRKSQKAHIKSVLNQVSKDRMKWAAKEKQLKRQVVKAEKLVTKRKHLVHVATSVHRYMSAPASDQFIAKEIAKTKKIFKHLNHQRARSESALTKQVTQDAKRITKLALQPGGQQEMNGVMQKAIEADKAGVGLDKTLRFINRKLTPSNARTDLGDGLTRDAYDAQHVAIQASGVESGQYGKHAAEVLKLKLARVDADQDPDLPLHGFSRNSLRRIQSKEDKALIQSRIAAAKKGPGGLPESTRYLATLVHRMHAHPGMNREQYDADMEAITKQRMAMATPEADKRERERAFERLQRVDEDWQKFKHSLKEVEQPAKDKKEEEQAQAAYEMKKSHEKGINHFERMWKSLPILPT